MKTIFKYSYIIISILILTLSSCSKSDEPENKYPDREVPEQLDNNAKSLLSNSEHEFAIDALKAVYKNCNRNENTCLSSYSSFLTLSMLANADNGSMKTRALNYMGLNGEFNLNVLNEYNKGVIEDLTSHNLYGSLPSGYIPVSIWHNESITLSDNFKDVVTSYYGASIINQSPTQESGKDAINDWVRKESHNYLDSYLNNAITESVLLVNPTFSFNLWQNTFSIENAYALDFHNIDHTISSLKGLGFERAQSVKYSNIDNVEVLALPFGTGDTMMYIYMPSSDVNFDTFVTALSLEKLDLLKENLASKKMILKIPRFTVNSQYNLVQLLSTKGNSWTFDALMSNQESLSLANIPCVGNIAVGENGTFADRVVPDLASEEPSVDSNVSLITVNRPFVFVIENVNTNVILTTGCITKL